MSDIHARLVDRLYAMPAWARAAGEPLEMTWAEFVEVWYASGTKGYGGDRNFRPPTAADVELGRVLGHRVAIVDEYGLRTDPPPPGKLRLSGGPFNGREIDAPKGAALVCIPELLPAGTVSDPHEMRAYTHEYHAHTGLYRRGRMPNDHIDIGGSFTWFGRRLERLLARIDRRRS